MLVPGDMPVATPVAAFIIAIEGAPLLQYPPAVAVLRLVADPRHTFSAPEIAAGTGFTVTVVAVLQEVSNV
jgi:hypothetical protein